MPPESQSTTRIQTNLCTCPPILRGHVRRIRSGRPAALCRPAGPVLDKLTCRDRRTSFSPVGHSVDGIVCWCLRHSTPPGFHRGEEEEIFSRRATRAGLSATTGVRSNACIGRRRPHSCLCCMPIRAIQMRCTGWLAGRGGQTRALNRTFHTRLRASDATINLPQRARAHGIHVSRETFPSVRKLGRSEVGSLVVFADRSTGSISRRRQMHVSRDGSSTYIAWSAPRGGVACLRAPRSGAPLLGTIRRASNSRPTPILPKPRSPTKLASCVPSHRPPQASPLH